MSPASMGREAPSSDAGSSLSRVDELTVLSYVDQLKHLAKGDQIRAHAARALGSLRVLIGPDQITAKVALELGVFHSLVDALEDPSYLVMSAVHQALANLFTPDKTEAHAAWHYLRKAAASLLEEPVLLTLTKQLRESTPVSVAAITRLLAGLCPHLQDYHEAALMSSGLVDVLLATTANAPLRDAVQCGAAALHLARAGPGLLLYMALPPPMSEIDAMIAAEMAPSWKRHSTSEAGGGVGRAKPAITASGLYTALCELYRHSILPENKANKADQGSEIVPGDVAMLFLKAITLDTAKGGGGTGEGTVRATAQKIVLQGMLDSPAMGCLMSYLVVDAGSVKHSLGEVCVKATEVLQGAGQAAAAEAAQGRQQLQLWRDELTEVKRALNEARDTGRLDEPWAMMLARRAKEIAYSGRQLQADMVTLDSRARTAREAINCFKEWGDRHSRVTGKVRRSTPHLKVMEKVLEAVQKLVVPGETPRGADKKLDGRLVSLRQSAQAALLAGGLIPTSIKLHHTAQATLELCVHLWSLMSDMGVGQQVAVSCQQALANVQMCSATVQRLGLRLKMSLVQAKDRSQRTRRRLAQQSLGVTLQGRAVDAVREEAVGQAWELVQLMLCEQEVQDLIQDLQHHEQVLQDALQYLDQSFDASETVIRPIADIVRGQRSTDKGLQDQRSAKSLPASGGPARDNSVTQAVLNSLAPLLNEHLSVLSQDTSPLLMSGLDRVMWPGAEGPQGPIPSANDRAQSRSDMVLRRSHSTNAQGAHDKESPALTIWGTSAGDVIALAQLELQLQSLSSMLKRAEEQFKGQGVCLAAAKQAWAAYSSQLMISQLTRILPPSLRTLIPEIGTVPLLSHPEYHALHDLLAQTDRLKSALPRLYFTQLVITAHWKASGVSGVEATAPAPTDDDVLQEILGGNPAAPAASTPGPATGSSSRPQSARALGRSVGVNATPGGRPSRPQSARPAGRLGAGGGAPGSKNSNSLTSNYKNVVFTMSPMKGCGPRKMGGGRDRARSELPGLRDSDLEQLPMTEQCEMVVSTVRSSVLMTLSKVQPVMDEEGTAGAVAGQEDDVMEDVGSEMGSQGWQHSTVQTWRLQREQQYAGVQRLAQQVSDVSGTMESLAALAQQMKSIRRRAGMLPCSAKISWQCIPADDLRRWMPQLMHMLTLALARPSDRLDVLDTITQAAQQTVTYPEDYRRVYQDTGMVTTLVKLLAASSHSQGPSKRQAPEPIGRFAVDPSAVSRPSATAARAQAGAAMALVAIGQVHPEALVAVASTGEDGSGGEDEASSAVLSDLLGLITDHSLPAEQRLQGVHLLASVCTCAARTSQDAPSTKGQGRGGEHQHQQQQQQPVMAAGLEARELAIESGAFGALLDVMDSDHRQLDPGLAKHEVVDALAVLVSSEELREVVVAATEAAEAGGLTAHASDTGLNHTTVTVTANTKGFRAVQLFPSVRTGDEVLRRVILSLWSPIKQLHCLMSTSRTKQGKYVDPEVVIPLVTLSLYSTRKLSTLADDEPLVRRYLQALGLCVRINTLFLQAIKDPELHEALLELRDKVPSRRTHNDDQDD